MDSKSHRIARFIFRSIFIFFLSLMSSSSGAGWNIQGAITLVHNIRRARPGASSSNNQNQLVMMEKAWDKAVRIIKS